jgi:hypothetical protein
VRAPATNGAHLAAPGDSTAVFFVAPREPSGGQQMSPKTKKRTAKKAAPRKKLAKKTAAKKKSPAKRAAAKKPAAKKTTTKAVKKTAKRAAVKPKPAPKVKAAPKAAHAAAERKPAARAPQRRDIVPEPLSDKHRLENETTDAIIGVEEFEEEEDFEEGYGDEEEDF